jgi:hypothetical protein
MRAAGRACRLVLISWLAFALPGCASGVAEVAHGRAARELRCREPALRVRAIGELDVLAWADHPVSLFEASGCEQEQVYVCADAGGARCERAIDDLPRPQAHAALTQALALLRTKSRARCPEAELRVVQESQTLFRFEACDGQWLYHCRARGCDWLQPRQR